MTHDLRLGAMPHTCGDGGSLYKNVSELFFSPLSHSREVKLKCNHLLKGKKSKHAFLSTPDEEPFVLSLCPLLLLAGFRPDSPCPLEESLRPPPTLPELVEGPPPRPPPSVPPPPPPLEAKWFLKRPITGLFTAIERINTSITDNWNEDSTFIATLQTLR